MPENKRRGSRYTKEQIAAINKRRAEKATNAESIRGKWHWFLTMQVIGFLMCIPIFAFLVPNLIISWVEILGIVTGIGIIGTLVQFTYFKKNKIITENLKLTTPLYLSYNFIGIGLTGLFLVLLFNNVFASSEPISEKHKIIGTDPEYQIYRWGSVVFIMDDDVYADYPDLRALPYAVYYKYKERPYIIYEFYQGLFGFKIKSDHRLAPKE